ncbi:MAG TPA: hypothetical protein VK856_10815 [Anaerolineaceae bacterium]|nr:hypothetical protein [Anaerolineaceae bacterium]
MEEFSNSPKTRKEISIFFPLLLIFIGVIILFSNLKMFPVDGWTFLIRIWPIIFIFGSFDDLLNRKWIGAVINFGIGTILILANFGFFPMTTWQIIMNFWPVLLIALGLDIIFKRQSIIPTLIGVIMSLLLLLGLSWFIIQGPLTKEAVSSTINYESIDAEKVNLSINPIVSNLNISDNKESESVISGEIFLANSEKLIEGLNTQDNIQEISLTTSGNVAFPARNMNDGFPWKLALNPEIPFNININQVIGLQRLDLANLLVDEINSKLVIGKMEVVLPDAKVLDANFECILGEMVLVIPEFIPVTIYLDSGITAVSVGEGFIREGDVIYSKQSRVNEGYILHVNLPIGSLKVSNP